MKTRQNLPEDPNEVHQLNKRQQSEQTNFVITQQDISVICPDLSERNSQRATNCRSNVFRGITSRPMRMVKRRENELLIQYSAFLCDLTVLFTSDRPQRSHTLVTTCLGRDIKIQFRQNPPFKYKYINMTQFHPSAQINFS